MDEYKRMRDEAKRSKELYPPGTRVELQHMEDQYHPVPPGTRGTVRMVDDAGQIHVDWDNGSGLALIPGTDSFTTVTDQGEAPVFEQTM